MLACGALRTGNQKKAQNALKEVRMVGKIAIIGDGDSITVFKAAGVAAFPVSDEKKAREALRKAAAEYQIIFLTEEFARPLSEFLKRFDEEPYPIVLSVPSGKGGAGYGAELLKSAMERALGVDIFSHH